MDNGVPIDWVGGSAQESVNLEESEEHDAPPCPNRRVPPFASNSSQGRADIVSVSAPYDTGPDSPEVECGADRAADQRICCVL
ncbi:unnamed protein product [Sphagnum troendelagicum]|uniref:Uncharacterized protein n=1 Tax=Sphagnum troendelagicum TaxID=128251 RepID=A0ABP0UWP9_9BRYO